MGVHGTDTQPLDGRLGEKSRSDPIPQWHMVTTECIPHKSKAVSTQGPWDSAFSGVTYWSSGSPDTG